MNSLLMVIISFAAFGFAYRFYGGFLQQEDFLVLIPEERRRHMSMSDGVDYVPTRKFILFGHHFVSIAGVTPMVGPAIAVIWGWLPALLWVVLGSIFIGGIHDFASLIHFHSQTRTFNRRYYRITYLARAHDSSCFLSFSSSCS